MLKGVNRYNGADREVLKIILEEAEPFFKGQKTFDETAELIQNESAHTLKNTPGSDLRLLH